jgi:type I restriction enzyme S subunit
MKEGWEIKKLGEVCKVIAGQSPEGKFYNSEGNGMPFYQGKKEYREKYIGEPTTWTTKITKEAEAGDILMSVRAPVGPVNFATQKICIGRGLAAIRAGKNIDKEFLFNYLIKHESEIEGNTGAVFNSINKKQIESIGFPLPPLPEQQRIVSILDRAFAAIDKAKANAKQNLQNAKELFESYLQGVFEKKGADWQTRTLSDLVDEECKLSYGIVQPGQDYHDGLPVVRPTDLSTRYIKRQGLKLIDPKLAEGYKRTKLIGDELLLCVRGSTGVLSIATEELKGANVTRGIVPIRFNLELIDQDFGYYLLISNFVQNQIRVKTYGAALMQINIGDLRKIETPYPKSLNEQQTIVRKLDSLRTETQNLEAVYQKKIADLEELKKSVLQKAFAGELETEKVVVV